MEFANIFRRTTIGYAEEPIREELFSIERLELYATTLASEHQISIVQRHVPILLQRLESNRRELIAAYHKLADAIRRERTISPAAEWLVDNFHIVEEQLREIREDLPKSYYDELPKLVTGNHAGFPRIYVIALTLIAHTDSRLDGETLRRFIHAYQHGAVLTIGELWAVAITLRLALIENLRRLATRIVDAREEREEAESFADKLIETAKRQPEELQTLLEERLGKRESSEHTFIVQLTQRLRDQDPEVMPAFDWLERYVARQSKTTEQIVHFEHQRQAATQVTVGNIITSMRLLSSLDWRDFFESVSLIDPVLAEDPAGVYARMDFATRDRYRHVVERIGKRTKRSEMDVARKAVELTQQSHERAPQHTERAHVGYYLIDDGLPELEQHFAYRPFVRERLRRAAVRHPTFVYFGTFSFLNILICLALVFYARHNGANVLWLIVVVLLSLIPSSSLAISILNWDFTSAFLPRVLPKMDATRGIPENAQTMVVIPTLFTSTEAVRELLEKLELHFLANREEHLYFALLGDYADAPDEEMPEDTDLLELAFTGIEELNKRYSSDSEARFHLFLRRRQWNQSEGVWMGWERKRGKLHEFNRLLRGAGDTSFIIATAEKALLAQTRYVITLDSDTQLPRDAACRLVATISHPLNQARFAADDKHRIVRGYAVLQPRVSISLTSAARSRFARVFSGNTGIDPYTTASSDLYQDLFGEGIYTGKGLYDVDAFETALVGHVPENRLLSHDLFESLYARTALLTDVEILDDYPPYYDSYAKRQHRWTRGDWQIIHWLLSSVPNSQGRSVKNTLPFIARWKIFDNLRRSLVAPMVLILLVAAWSVMPGSPLVWTLFVVVVLAFPVYAHVTTSLLQHPRGITWTSHFQSVWDDALTNTAQVALTVVFLAHQAYLMVDAIARTLYRKLISRKKLLEWMTAAEVESNSRHDRAAFFHFMWPAEPLVAASLLLLFIGRPSALLVALPFLFVWAISPLIAQRISALRLIERGRLSAKEVIEARLMARRTWRFFETFVGSEDHWLPPDNFQEDPRPAIAHRTSPTNIGLLLLSTIAAHDLASWVSLNSSNVLS
ncbi:MAG: hypothetical protein ACRD63_00105 [Pyrinomonadaceae bacterium]